MEAKKNGRLTIKILSEEVDKELKKLKQIVTSLENRLDGSEQKVKYLEEKLAQKAGETENLDEMHIKCKFCEETFISKRNLKKHLRDSHPIQIKCNDCTEIFVKNSDLEVHLEEQHVRSMEYKCDKCDKKFALKWRLKKHLEVHSKENTKFCHYFNNEKYCPYERIGCKFLHQNSSICYFGKRCANNLCQFRHSEQSYNADDDDLRDKFEKLSEMEKDESKEVFCDIYCNRGYDSHRCSEETNELFIGCDMKNITDVFENEDDLEEEPVTYFPCKVCDNMFDAHEKLNTHFKESHTPDKSVKCSLNQCEFASKKINVLIMHIGVNHLDIVKRKL